MKASVRLSLDIITWLLMKRKLIVLLLVLEVSICLGLYAGLRTHQLRSKSKVDTYNALHGEKSYFVLREYMNDIDYQLYLKDDGSRYFSLLELVNQLFLSDDFDFVVMRDQHLELTNKVDDRFLLDYESGNGNKDGFSCEGVQYYPLKCLQVSEEFFGEFIVSVESGRAFSSDDYIAPTQRPATIPILLGNGYKDFLPIGSRQSGFYMDQYFSFEVVGLLSKESFFFSREANKLVPCENYIIMPAMIPNLTSTTHFDRARILQLAEGLIVTKMPFKQAENALSETKRATNTTHLNIGIADPNPSTDEHNTTIFDTYSSMNDSILIGIALSLANLIWVSVFTISITIRRIINEKRHEIGLLQMLGTPTYAIFAGICITLGAVFIAGWGIAALVNGVSNISLLVEMAAVSTLMLLLSLVAVFAEIMNIDIALAVKGKE